MDGWLDGWAGWAGLDLAGLDWVSRLRAEGWLAGWLAGWLGWLSRLRAEGWLTEMQLESSSLNKKTLQLVLIQFNFL